MTGLQRLKSNIATAVVLVVAGSIGAAQAAGTCGVCDTEVVTNKQLAQCFLDQYEQLVAKANGAVIVDLSECEQARGVIEPLPPPGVVVEEPDLEFMLSRAQLDCLKAKLEDPAIDLDPSAKIDLASCG